MSSYIVNEEMLGGNWFTNALAKIDPTSKKTIVGKIVQAMPIVGTYVQAASAVGAGIRADQKSRVKTVATPQAPSSPSAGIPNVPVDMAVTKARTKRKARYR